MQALTWENLPTDVLQEILFQPTNFAAVIQLTETNKQIQATLGCQRIVVNPRLTSLLDEVNQCELLPSQYQLLQQLNRKFNLGVEGKLTFARLKRAYNRSMANPQCVEHSSLVNCLKSAAKLGLTDQLRPSFDEAKPSLWNRWLAEYRRLVIAAASASLFDPDDLPDDIVEAPWYCDFHTKLAIIAYKHSHIELGNTLLRCEGYGISEAPIMDEVFYWEAKANCKAILRPFKVLTSKQIREQYSSLLFDPAVPDAEKAEIWRTKYQLTEEDIARLKMSADKDPMYHLALAKLGVYYSGGNVEDVEDTVAIFWVMAGESEYLDEMSSDLLSMCTILALKRGYFELAKKLDGSINLRTSLLVFDRSKFIFEFLQNFTLQEIERFYQGFSATFPTETPLFSALVFGNCTQAYFEYVAKYEIGQSDLEALSGTKSLEISDDLIRRLDPEIGGIASGLWSIYGGWLLVKIWLRYGRRQFEDSLLYLRIKFLRIFPERLLLYNAVQLGSLSLVAYLFGYQINSQNQLTPLETPGIIKVNNDDLIRVYKDRKLPVGLGMFDMLLMINDILNVPSK